MRPGYDCPGNGNTTFPRAGSCRTPNPSRIVSDVVFRCDSLVGLDLFRLGFLLRLASLAREVYGVFLGVSPLPSGFPPTVLQG